MAAAEPPESGASDSVRHLAAILDYVAADYPGAVADGRIVNQTEYDEQLSFIADADEIAAELPPVDDGALRLRDDIAELRGLVNTRAQGREVAKAARELRARMLDGYGVSVAPAVAPSLERGAALFAENCAQCHGERGGGDGHRAHELDPRPRSFHDSEVMRDMTPARAFSALQFGLDGTAMASFEALPSSDRWSLAYYVFTLRHDPGAVGRGADAYRRSSGVVPSTAAGLAELSDGAILTAMIDAGLDEPARHDALAYLRAAAPYRTSGATFDVARRHLADGLRHYQAGRHSDASREFNLAYLEGFEPREAVLRAEGADMVTRIETAFLDLRTASERGVDDDQIESRVLHIGALLDAGEQRMGGGGGGVSFVSAFAVILREGVEAALLILLLLGLAKRSGVEARDRRAVHAGWIAALGLGVVAWLAADSIVAGISGAQREIVEGAVAIFAAVVLLIASHYVLSRLDAKRRVAALKDKLAAATSGRHRWFVLASLAFVAVFREVFEVVLFLQAILLDGQGSGVFVALGALAGVGALGVFVVLLQRLGRKLKPAPLLTAAGGLLCVLSFVLIGKGMRALQEAAVIGIDPLPVPRIDWLGVYPTTQTVTAQILTLAAFGGIALWSVWRSRVAAAAGPQAQSAA